MSKKIETLMVIDDDEVDQMLYSRIAQRSGIVRKFLPFRCPTEALDYLRSAAVSEVDVILLDINMPRMSGFEFLEQALAEFGNNFAQIVVFMLTTSLDPADQERAREFNVVKDYLSKPLSPDQLKEIASKLRASH